MKNGLALLTLLFLTVQEDSHWRSNPGALLISSTDMFAVNKAKNVRPDEVLASFANASLKIHKEIKGRGVWVFNTESGDDVQKQKEAMIPLTPSKDPNKQNELVLDGTVFTKKLLELGIQFPSTDMQLSENLGSAEQLIEASQNNKEVKSWYLLGRSKRNASAPLANPRGVVPPPVPQQEKAGEKKEVATVEEESKALPIHDQSILIEWGHAEKIQKIKEGLYQEENGAPVQDKDKAVIDQVKIYEKHFFKFPIKLQVQVSHANDGKNQKAKNLATIETLFAVRPQQGARVLNKEGKSSQDQRGFLLFYSAGEKEGTVLKALELKLFEVTKTSMRIQVPLQCLVSEVIRRAVGKDFKVPTLEEGSSSQNSVIQETDETTKVKTLLLDLNPKLDKAKGSRLENARFLLDFDDITESYSVVASEGRDVTLPVTDKTPITIFDKGCNEIQKIQ